MESSRQKDREETPGEAAARLEELPVRLHRGEVERRREEIVETLEQVREAIIWEAHAIYAGGSLEETPEPYQPGLAALLRVESLLSGDVGDWFEELLEPEYRAETEGRLRAYREELISQRRRRERRPDAQPRGRARRGPGRAVER